MKDWRGSEVQEGSIVTGTVARNEYGQRSPFLGVVLKLGPKWPTVRVLSHGTLKRSVAETQFKAPESLTVVGNYFDDIDYMVWDLRRVEELEAIWDVRAAKVRKEIEDGIR